MFRSQLVVRCGCLLAALAPAAAAVAAEKTLDRSFEVAAGGRLNVVAEALDIEVAGSSTNQVVVRVVISGSQSSLDAMTLSAEQTGNDVSVTAKSKVRMFGRVRLDGRITVSVPRRYDIELKTSGGNITAANIEGDVEARTSGGNVEATNVTGATLAQTSGGNVVARGTRGETQLLTSGGNITAEVLGKLDAKTSGGDIRVQLNGPNQGISATTSGGSIELELPRDTRATVDASTSGGTVSSALPTVATQKTRQRLAGTLNGGGEPVYARSSGGDVRLVERGTQK